MKGKTLSILTLFLILYIIFPFYWQVSTSFKSPDEMFKKPPSIFPKSLYFRNYIEVFTSGRPFGRYILNSFIVSSSTTIASILIGSFAAYALSRSQFRGKNIFLGGILGLAMFPQIAILSPIFTIFRKLGLLNTYAALILPYTTFSLPLSIWILTNFFKDIPVEIEEAALIDGCTPLQVLRRVIAPLAAPGVFTCAILVFIYAWNEFLFALTLNTRDAMRTITVGITMFPGLYEIPWGTIFAASTLVTLPLIILVLLFQRKIIAGLTAGAVKG